MEEFIKALQSQDTEAVKYHLERGASANAMIEVLHSTPLQYAAKVGNGEITSLLINAGANLDAQDLQKCTALLLAAMNNHYEVAKRLIEAGANTQIPMDNNDYPLELTTHHEIGRLLLKEEAKISPINPAPKDKYSPFKTIYDTKLRKAATFGNAKVVQQFLNVGAMQIYDEKDRYPLQLAAHNGHDDIVDILLKTDNVMVESKDKEGLTPICHAAYSDNVKTMQMLVNKGAKIVYVTKKGESPLSIAAGKGNRNVVKYLLQNGGNNGYIEYIRQLRVYNLVPSGPPIFPANRALINAAAKGHDDIVEELLNIVTQKDRHSSTGSEALAKAAENGHLNTVNLLIQAGVLCDFKKEDGTTPIFLAKKNGYQAIVNRLMEVGAILDV